MKLRNILISACLTAFAPATMAATFANGGFENGDLNGWTQGGGTWNSGAAPLDPATFVGGPSLNTVMSGGTDAITGANTVYGGNHSVRVNDSAVGARVSTLSQTVTNYTDNAIFFAWNAVLEDSHGIKDSGHFSLQLVDNTTNKTLVSRAYSSAGAIGSGTTGVNWSTYNSGFSTWYSSGWVVESIDLVALGAVGNTFTLSLLAADCFQTGHGGYVYLDGFGAVTPPTDPSAVPLPTAAWLFGSVLAGFAGFGRKKRV